ncbi:MAG: Rrf2 family transcriptional regulator [Planctomycetaceae bacterium]|nr:Rrf2 family transcriptional regulator [Planctomycetaceae bacterium]
MMGLTKKTGYGLTAMAHLAHLPQGQLATAREIAHQYEIPQALMMNVMKRLAAAGYVESVRGAHGGYRLAKHLSDVTLEEFSTRLEGPVRLAACISHVTGDSTACTQANQMLCPVHDPVHRVQRRLQDFLKRVTLAEIVDPALTGARE